MAHPNRNHRNRSIAYDRCVAAERPEACNSLRNAVTETTGSPGAVDQPNRLPQIAACLDRTDRRHHQRREITTFTAAHDHGRGT
jgi:hypothetical protein